MDKQNVANTYNGIQSKKKGNSDICCNMNKLWGNYSKLNKAVTKDKHCKILFIWGI